MKIQSESFVFLIPHNHKLKNELLHSKIEENYNFTCTRPPCEVYGVHSPFAANTHKLLNTRELIEFYEDCAENNLQKLRKDCVYLVSKENFSDLCEKDWVDLSNHLPIIKTAIFTFVRT